MATAIPLIFDEVTAMAFKLEHIMKHIQLRAKAGWFVNRLKMFKKIGTVPRWHSSRIHRSSREERFSCGRTAVSCSCLENMWLKATALDLGFQLVSATAQMANNPSFCEMLGINPSEWALRNG
jgi:Nitroreductase family